MGCTTTTPTPEWTMGPETGSDTIPPPGEQNDTQV